MKLRPATVDDAALLLEWRNDCFTREASVNAESVDWDDHVKWLRSSLSSPAQKLLVAEVDGEPVGTVKIDDGDEVEVSWTVAPLARGKGFGKQMVQAALPDGPVIAHIKRENIASQRIATAAGFEIISDEPLQRWARD